MTDRYVLLSLLLAACGGSSISAHTDAATDADVVVDAQLDGAMPPDDVDAARVPDAGSASDASEKTDAGKAPTTTTAALLTYIKSLSAETRHILLGQHANYWDSNPMDIVTPIPNDSGGKQVAILGTSNFWVNSDGVSSSSTSWFVSTTNAWLAGGGIVVVSQEAANPLSNGEAVTDIWTSGKSANTKWKAFLDDQVELFKQLKGAVVWRPFIEVNGNHFGSQFTPSQFQSLWQYTHDYAISQGLDNVLWMFNLNYWDPNNKASQYYPGSAYVDIVSLDSYPPDSNSDNVYNFYLSTGKPIMFAEAGVNGGGATNSGDNSTMLAGVKSKFPEAVALIVWCQTWALVDQGGLSATLNDPAVITKSNLPSGL